MTEYELFCDLQDVFRRVTLQLRYGIENYQMCERWAICRQSACLNKTAVAGKYYFVEEPLPSARDDEYLADCRFATAAEACEFWLCHFEDIIIPVRYFTLPTVNPLAVARTEAS